MKLFTLLLLFHVIQAQDIIRAPILRQSRPLSHINKRDPFSALLYNDAGSQYLIEVSIGTPAQNFTVTLDTGSADLWIPGSSCSNLQCPNTNFQESQSSTFKALDIPFSLQYGVGNVNGTYVTDTVSIAGATVSNQQFGLASATASILTNQNTVTVSNIKSLAATTTKAVANGIFGLGFPKLTSSSSKGHGAYNPFVFSLANQGIIKQPIFSVYLNNAQSTGWVGEIIFGGTDTSKYTGDIAYLPVLSLSSTKKRRRGLPDNSSKYYWMVGAQGFAVTVDGSDNLNVTFSNVGGYILDTGTTLSYLPQSMAEQIVEKVAGKGGYALDSSSGSYLIDCQAAQTTAIFELKMTSTNSLTDEPVVFKIPASSLVLPLDGTSTDNANHCLFGIAPTVSSSLGNNLYLIGESILRSAYMVFDMENNRVGLATAQGAQGSIQGISAAQKTSNSNHTYSSHSIFFVLFCSLLLVWAHI